MRRLPINTLRHPATLLLLLLLGLLSGCANDKQVIGQAQEVHGELKPAVLEDPVVAGYVQQVGDRIVATAKELDQQGFGPESHKDGQNNWMFDGIQFHLVNSKTLNAFTTGGKHVYLYNELFQSCQTEDEFAAVVAHEFGHIYARHVQKGMNRQYTMLGAAAAAGAAGYALGGDDAATYAGLGAGGALAIGQFANMGFTRKDENEADKLGFQFYVRSGWDPAQFDGFFRVMIEKGYDTTPEIASDHPSLANRVTNTERRVKELPPNADQWRRSDIVGPERFHEIQQRAAQVAKSAPDDSTLQAAQLMFSAFPSCVAPIEQPSQKAAQAKLAAIAERQQQQGK